MTSNYLSAVMLLMVLLIARAAQAGEIFSGKVLSFEIKPNVCIVKQIGQQCALTFNVSWRTVEPMDICLVEQQQVLQCWINEQQVDETTDVLLQKSTTVDLVDNERTVLAQEELQVNAAQPKNRRRRLRSAWSLF